MKKLYFLTFALLMIFSLKAQTLASELDTANYPYWIEMMQDHSINIKKTQSAFEKYWSGRKRSKGDGWKVFKRWESFWEARVNPDGSFPAQGQVLEAYQQMLQGPLQSTNGSWIPLGPIDVPMNSTGQPNGIGRVNSITIDPLNSSILWLGTPSGGLWKSINSGLSWTPITDNMPTLGVSAVLIDSANTNIMYMGTGDRDAGDAPGMGVWKSTNGGTTWQASNNGMGNKTVGMMLMKPSNHNELLAATSGGVYRTIDAGVNWTKTSITANFKDIKYKPGNSNIVYATASGDFYRSTNGGISFTKITSGLPTNGQRLVIGVSPANSNYVYVLIGNSSGLVGVYRSTNSGISFSTMATSPNLLGYNINGSDNASQAWYDLAIAVDPTDINTIYAGGINIWKSTNGGSSWNITAHWIGSFSVPAVHADQHALVFDGSKLYAACDGGLYYTTNGGSSWTDISDGLAISQLYKFGQSATDSNLFISGFQDNGTAVWHGTGMWLTEIGGDGMNCLIDPNATSYMYGSLYYGDIRRSTNVGSSFGTIAKNGVNGINESGAWVTPYTLQSNNSNTMYIGYKNVWRSTNVKVSGNSNVSWTKISNFGSSSNLRVIESCLADPNILYVGRGATLFRSDNVQSVSPIWSTLSVSGTLHDIATDPNNSSIVYVAVGNNIYKSTNKGSSWVAISGNLPNVSINTLVLDTTKTEAIYVGTDVGVFYKEQGMSNWVNFSSGLPAAAEVTDIEIYYGASSTQHKLRVSTYGRGMWSSDLYAPANVPPVADFSAASQLVCQGGSTAFTDLSSNNPNSWSWSVSPSTHSFIASTSASSQNPIIKFTATGNYTIQLIASNAYGSDTLVKTAYISVASPSSVPFIEDFETFTTGNPGTWANGWTFNNSGVFNWRANSGGTFSQYTGPNVDHTSGSTSGIYLYTESSSPAVQGEVTELISPCVAIPSTGNISLSFWYHMYGQDITGLHVDIHHNGVWTNDIYTILGQQQLSNGSPWLNATVSLSAYSGSTIKLRFRVIRGANYRGDVAIDDIFIGVPGAPAADFTSAETTTCVGGALNIVDASSNSPTSWKWLISPSTVNFINNTTDTSQNPFIKFNNAGNYSVTLIVNNASGSDTITKTNYITVGAAMPLPFSENFESFIVGTPGSLNNSWLSVNTGGNFPWTVNSGPTPTTNSGPTIDHTLGTASGKYLFTEASNPAAQGDETSLISPCIDMSSAVNGAKLKFWYHMYGADILGLHVDVKYNGFWINDVYTIVGQQQTSNTAAWQQAIVNLSAYTSSSVKIRFRVIRGASYNGDVAIDDVTIDAISLPVNDEPCAAISLNVGTSCNYFTTNNIDATASVGIPAPGCGGSVYEDVWFKAIAPISGGLVIDADQVLGSFSDGAMAAYSGSCSNLVLLACNDDYGGNATMPHIQLNNLTAGDTIYIRFWKYNGGGGNFKICVYEPPYFQLGPSSITIGSAAGSATISALAQTATSWTVSDNASWLTLTPTSGSGNATITLNYSANSGGNRTALITGTSAGLPNQTVIVSQTSSVMADFTIVSPYVCLGSSVSFTNTSINGNSYKWYVDGVQVSTQTNYSHTFNTSGIYQIKLVAFGSLVNDSITKQIFVGTMPIANAGVDITVCEGSSVNLNPVISTGIVSCNSACTMPNTCVSASSNDSYEYIVNMQLNGASQSSTSTGAGYEDYSQSLFTPLMKDSTYTLQLTAHTSASYLEYADVFIDWNRNGLFDEPAISMGSATFSGTHVFVGIVTVPSNAVLGKTKMRAILKYNSSITGGCENAYAYGETEDYMIDILGIDTLSYAWSGPQSFVSSQVNPLISNIQTTQAGTYNLTITNGFGCSDSDTKLLNVNTKPNASFASLADVCISTPPFILTQGNPAGGVYSGTGVSGNTFSPSTAGVGTHNLFYVVSNANSCTDTATQLITVNALPIVSFSGLASSLCENAAINSLIGTPAGGIFSGLGIINGNEFDPSVAGAGSHTISYSYTDANNCSDSASQMVTVNDLPDVNAGNDTTVNYGTAAQLQASVVGSGSYNYFWTPSNKVINSTSASTSTIAMIASQQFNVLVSNTITTCSDSDQVMVNVSGGPLTASVSPTSANICANDSIQLLVTASGGTGSYTYSWSSNPPGFSSTLMNPWVGPGTYTCIVTSGTFTTTVVSTINSSPLPNVSLTSFNPVCQGTDSIILSGGLPAGGIYSGVGVINGVFYPDVAGVGTHNIAYTYSNSNMCSATAIQSIVVNPKPIVSLANFPSLCNSSASFIMTQGSPYGGVYSGPGVSGSSFNPGVAGIGTHTIVYTFTDANSCSSSDTNTISVNSGPIANAGLDQTISSGASATLVGTASGGSGSYAYNWNPAAKVNNANSAATNTINLTTSTLYTFKVLDTQTQCSDSDQVIVTVVGGPLSAIVNVSKTPICFGDSTSLTAIGTGGTGNYSYSWTSSPAGFTSTLPNPVVSPSVTTAYILQLSDGIDTVTTTSPFIIVDILPIITLPSDTSVCQNSSIVLDAGAGYATYSWSDGSTQQTNNINANNLPLGSTMYYVTVTNTLGCSAFDSVDVNVVTPPNINLGPDQSILTSTSTVLDAGAGYMQYLWSTGETTQTIIVDGAQLGVGIYDYWAQAWSANDCYATDSILVIVNNDIGIGDDQSDEYFVNVYPNPSKGLFNIELNGFKKENINIYVYNAQAQLVYQRSYDVLNHQENLRLDLREMARGVYTLRFNSKTVNHIEKLIVK